MLVYLAACASYANDGDRPAPVDAGAEIAAPPPPPDDAASNACDPSKPFGPLVFFPAPIRAPSNEWAGAFSHDRLTLWFCSDRPGSTATDIYVSQRTGLDAPWSDPRLETALSSPAIDCGPRPSADGLTMYLDTNRGDGGRDIYVARRASTQAEWDTPVPLAGLDTADDELAVTLFGGGTVAFFTRGMIADLSTLDLWTASRADTSSPFGTAVRVHTLSSPATDMYPMVTEDGLRLLFTSNRDAGSYAVWTATRPSPGVDWSVPVLVPELTVAQDDRPVWMSPDGCTIMIATNQSGSMDLAYATRPR